MRKITLIDDNADKGWGLVFRHLLGDIFGNLIEFEVLAIPLDMQSFWFAAYHRISESTKDDLFILDNNFGDYEKTGLDILREFGIMKGNIILHTANRNIGYDAAICGAKYFMIKDNPSDQMSNKQMTQMVRKFLQTVITYYGLAPELIWIFDLKHM